VVAIRETFGFMEREYHRVKHQNKKLYATVSRLRCCLQYHLFVELFVFVFVLSVLLSMNQCDVI
jgi:hypothetical protein